MPVFTNNTFKIPEAISKILYIYLLLTDVILKKICGEERLEI
jgi:hypothetical protein